MRFLSICILCLFVFVMAASAGATEIQLKKSFWSGWHYTVDGSNYMKVGVTGKTLHRAMEGNEAAQDAMQRYRTRRTIARITAIPGGALIGWPLGTQLAGGESKDSYTTMYIVGGAFSVISIIYELSATKHLKEGVRLFNEGDQSLDLKLGIAPNLAFGGQQVQVGIHWNF